MGAFPVRWTFYVPQDFLLELLLHIPFVIDLASAPKLPCFFSTERVKLVGSMDIAHFTGEAGFP